MQEGFLIQQLLSTPSLIIFVLIIVILIYLALIPIRATRFERRLPTSKIGSISPGLIEIKGRIRPIKTLKSPYFGKDCVVYRYVKHRVKRETNGSNREGSSARKKFIKIDEEIDHTPFELFDGSGSVLIDVDGLEIEKTIIHYGYNHDETDIRHSEMRLEPDTEVLIIGNAFQRDGKLVICKDKHHKVFSLKPYSVVVKERQRAPLFFIFKLYAVITIAAVAALIVV